ncbi:hypothetical protein CAPTEDRAFT_226432 [Capitella teleta]|uniref:SUEL-type lectin domain-containing protein n=1 Tax=Capitella teleta TaxID=283909 RepID=R7U3Q0_CAPTE|nr:hypothetical protein CAPTEDRAFT_226432 [Capitella teleta]|eukprot:ELU00945.1 hypothetical protein CAPTEDRAFT_226432 [Capitella teleta]
MWIALSVLGVYVTCVWGEQTVERCLSESFAPECRSDELLVITSASFGRMATGRCMPRDYGNGGCQADVRSFVDAHCSGRRRCHIEVTDIVQLKVKPCPEGFSSYLKVTYNCHKVVRPSLNECQVHGETRPLQPSGFLLPFNNEQSTSSHCPLVIEAKPGQTINITLHFFQYDPAYSSIAKTLQTKSHCLLVAVAREQNRSSPICARQQRVMNVFLSESNRVEIDASKFASNDTLFTYLLEYAVVGCALPYFPHAVHLEREGPRLRISCNGTGHVWTTHCVDGIWKNLGEIYCPDDRLWSPQTYDWSTTKGMVIIVSLGVLIGFVLGLTLLGCSMVCINRCRQRRRRRGLRRQEQQDCSYRISDVINPLVGHRDPYVMEQAPTGDTWPGRSASLHSLRTGQPKMGRTGSGSRLQGQHSVDGLRSSGVHLYESPHHAMAARKDTWPR